MIRFTSNLKSLETLQSTTDASEMQEPKKGRQIYIEAHNVKTKQHSKWN